MIWTRTQRSWYKSSRCSPTHVFQLNKSFPSSKCGMNLFFYRRLIFFPSLGFLTPNLINGCTRQPSCIMYYIFDWLLFFFFFQGHSLFRFYFYTLRLKWSKSLMQQYMIFSLVVRKVPNMIYVSSYIK